MRLGGNCVGHEARRCAIWASRRTLRLFFACFGVKVFLICQQEREQEQEPLTAEIAEKGRRDRGEKQRSGEGQAAEIVKLILLAVGRFDCHTRVFDRRRGYD